MKALVAVVALLVVAFGGWVAGQNSVKPQPADPRLARLEEMERKLAYTRSALENAEDYASEGWKKYADARFYTLLELDPKRLDSRETRRAVKTWWGPHVDVFESVAVVSGRTENFSVRKREGHIRVELLLDGAITAQRDINFDLESRKGFDWRLEFPVTARGDYGAQVWVRGDD